MSCGWNSFCLNQIRHCCVMCMLCMLFKCYTPYFVSLLYIIIVSLSYYISSHRVTDVSSIPAELSHLPASLPTPRELLPLPFFSEFVSQRHLIVYPFLLLFCFFKAMVKRDPTPFLSAIVFCGLPFRAQFLLCFTSRGTNFLHPA